VSLWDAGFTLEVSPSNVWAIASIDWASSALIDVGSI